MKEILIISADVLDPLKWSGDFKDFIHHVKLRSHSDISTTHYENLVFSVIENQLEVIDHAHHRSLADFDLVYLRTWQKAFAAEAAAVAHFLSHRHKDFLDQEPLHSGAINKLIEHFLLAKSGLPVIDTVFAYDVTRLGPAIAYHEFAWPMVLKDVTGSKGRNNFFINNAQELQNTLTAYPDVRFLAQRFVPNEYDFRILVLGNKVGTVSQRIRQNKQDHRNNSYLGAIEEEVPISSFPTDILQDAIRAAQVLHRQIAGVDIIVDNVTGQHYILEVNYAPGITYDETILSELPQLVQYLDRA